MFGGSSDGGGDGGGDDSDGGGSNGDGNTPESTPSPSPTSTPTEESTPTETSTPQSQSATVSVGEPVEGDNLSMVVRGVSKTEQIGEFQQADSGNTFVIVRLAVKNTTDNEFINFSGFLQTTLKDSEGYNYSQTIAATGQTLTGGQLVPGEVARGDIAYEVPKDAQGLTLQFDFQAFSIFKFERVVVNLNNQASLIADLQQNLNIDIHSTGDEVTFADTIASFISNYSYWV